VYIEHCDRLSWFSDKRESHEQDGEMLAFAMTSRIPTASGDPAMALGLSIDRTGNWPITPIGNFFAAGQNGGCILQTATTRAGPPARKLFSAGYPAFQ
jgi:hypothetical protein